MRIGCSNEVGRVLLFCRGLRARRVGDLFGRRGFGRTCGRGGLGDGQSLDFLEGDAGLAWLASEKGSIEDVGAGIRSVAFGLALRLVGVLEARI